VSDFLATIARERRDQVLRDDRFRSLRDLREEAEARHGDVRPFAARLKRSAGERLRVIAEVKKASPSAGVLCVEYDPAGTAAAYEAAGASAISVLTEPARFLGSMEHLASARARVTLPVLAKDFVVHERQIYESRAHGADAILLIVALLDRSQLKDYASLARDVGLDPMLEVFDERDLERALGLPGVIGANNRNLRTLGVDTGRAERLLAAVPAERVRVAESGYRERGEIEGLTRLGIDGVLIGETLLRAASAKEGFASLFGPPAGETAPP
jgi:indole-3-glycerol phosphate synthase